VAALTDRTLIQRGTNRPPTNGRQRQRRDTRATWCFWTQIPSRISRTLDESRRSFVAGRFLTETETRQAAWHKQRSADGSKASTTTPPRRTPLRAYASSAGCATRDRRRRAHLAHILDLLAEELVVFMRMNSKCGPSSDSVHVLRDPGRRLIASGSGLMSVRSSWAAAALSEI